MPYRLKDARERHLQPQLLLAGLVSHLDMCAKMFRAVGTAQADERWLEVAAALRAAADVLRKTQLLRF